MNPTMNITVATTRSVSIEDDTTAAREHSAVGLDSWLSIFPDSVYIDANGKTSIILPSALNFDDLIMVI
jgi:hypothetical protein